MGAKNISIPESVYRKLSEEKREDESFGDAIDRLLGGEPLSTFWGGWSDDTAVKAREAIQEGRDRTDRKLQRRYD